MKDSLRQRIASIAALVAAVALLAIGGIRVFVVQPAEGAGQEMVDSPPLPTPPPFPGAPVAFPPPPPPPAPSAAAEAQQISDRILVANATFSGVERQDGELRFTYDPSAPSTGKRACPT